MASISIHLDDRQLDRFREPAELLGTTPEELAAESIPRLLESSDDELRQVIDEIIASRLAVLKRLAQ